MVSAYNLRLIFIFAVLKRWLLQLETEDSFIFIIIVVLLSETVSVVAGAVKFIGAMCVTMPNSLQPLLNMAI